MSQEPLNALIDLLTQEDEIYSEMAQLLDEERSALLAMIPQPVFDVLARKETLALRIKAMDESRKMLAHRLGRSLGLDQEGLTISAICERIPTAEAGRLRAVAERLKQTVLNCQSMNKRNARAASHGMAIVNSAVRQMIDEADPAGKLYHNPKAGHGYGGPRPGGVSAFVSRQA